jgi:hypothetical protein
MTGVSADSGLPPDLAAALAGGGKFADRYEALVRAREEADEARANLRIALAIDTGLKEVASMKQEAQVRLQEAARMADEKLRQANMDAQAIRDAATRDAQAVVNKAEAVRAKADQEAARVLADARSVLDGAAKRAAEIETKHKEHDAAMARMHEETQRAEKARAAHEAAASRHKEMAESVKIMARRLAEAL